MSAFFTSKDAPIEINPSGVASLAILSVKFTNKVGLGILRSDHISPMIIPIMIGFLAIPTAVFFISSLLPLFSLSFSAVNISIITAKMLYSGTLPSIMRGPIPVLASP